MGLLIPNRKHYKIMDKQNNRMIVASCAMNPDSIPYTLEQLRKVREIMTDNQKVRTEVDNTIIEILRLEE